MFCASGYAVFLAFTRTATYAPLAGRRVSCFGLGDKDITEKQFVVTSECTLAFKMKLRVCHTPVLAPPLPGWWPPCSAAAAAVLGPPVGVESSLQRGGESDARLPLGGGLPWQGRFFLGKRAV